MAEKPRPSDDPLEEWVQQLRSDPVLAAVVKAAKAGGRGCQIVLRMRADGKVLSPKTTVGE